jgi:hypothetical protein
LKQTPFERQMQLEPPQSPKIPFSADGATVSRIQKSLWW